MAMERTPMTSRDVFWVALPISPNPGPALAQDVPPRGPGGTILGMARAPTLAHCRPGAPAPWGGSPTPEGPHGLLGTRGGVGCFHEVPSQIHALSVTSGIDFYFAYSALKTYEIGPMKG
jgi:hypothetical protein